MVEGTGLIGVEQSRDGVSVVDNSRIVRLFKITGGTNPYSADEVQLDEGDGSLLNTGVYDIEEDTNQLWELSGNSGVPVDSIVVGHPNPAGTGFIFLGGTVLAASTLVTTGLAFVSWTAATGVWTDVPGLSTSAAAGTYLIDYTLHGAARGSVVGNEVDSQLVVNGSVPASAPGPASLVSLQSTGSTFFNGTTSWSWVATLAGSDVVKVQVRRTFTGTFDSSISPTSAGASILRLIKIG